MRKNMRAMLAAVACLLAVSVLTGCTIHLRFYPVQGAIAAATPNQVFAGKITASSAFNPKSGGFSAVLGDGETFRGNWSMVGTAAAGKDEVDAGPGTKPISNAWDAVYGPGYYVAHVLGQRQYGRSVSTGSKGTVLQVEICSTAATAEQTKAVAQDSKGNIYKVTPY